MPDFILYVLYELSHLIFTTTLWDRHYFYFYFTEKWNNIKRLCDLGSKQTQATNFRMYYNTMTYQYTTALDYLCDSDYFSLKLSYMHGF